MNNIKISYLSFFVFMIIGALVFAGIEDPSSKDKNIKNNSFENSFDKVMAVLTHERCVNCHPASNRPLQGEGDQIHFHNFGIQRGEDNHGLAGYKCNTCHTDSNNDFSGVPGAPHWSLAPLSMAWEGKTRIEIAEQMMDPKRNGGRTPSEIMEHLTEHELVLWAWEPGVDAEGKQREKPPVSKDEFILAVKDWINNGAIIPES